MSKLDDCVSKADALSTVESAKQMIRSKTGHQLQKTLNGNLDPKVKKLIEKELDDRGRRGWPLDKANP